MISRLRLSVFLLCLLGFTGLLTAQNEAYILGDADNNLFTTVRAFDDGIYAVGQVNDGNENFGTFSRIDPTNGQVLWTSRMDVESTFLDFIRDDEGTFILVGRTDIRVGLNGAFLDNESLIARVDDNGNFLGVRSYNLDTQPNLMDGRETFSKIVRNPNPLNEEFPYYVFGVRDRDDVNFPNTWDDVTMAMVDINLNIGFYQRMSSNLNGAGQDDEFIRAAAPLMDGSGNIILAGNGSGPVVNIVIIDNQGQYVNGATFPANQLQTVRDLLVLPEGDFIFVGQTAGANSNNFIIRVDPALSTIIWQFELFNQGRFDNIIQFGEAYYTVARNFGGVNEFFVNRIIDVGNTAFLDWTASLDDNDAINNWPFLATDGNNLIYGDSRTPNAVGTGTSAGFGGNDVLLTVTDETLETCITEFEGIEMVQLDLDIMRLVTDEERMEIPEFRGRELFTIEYLSENYCEDCGAMTATQTTFDCTNGFSYTFDVNFINTSGFDVDFVSVTPISPAGVSTTPPNYNFFFNPILDGTTSPTQQLTVNFTNPITVPTTVCVEVDYFSNGQECCHYEFCFVVQPVDPCDDVSATLTADPAATCCYDLELNNNFCEDYFTGIRTVLTTPGLSFSVLNGGANWIGTQTATNTINWDYTPGGTLPLGVLNGINFCVAGVGPQTPPTQQMDVQWLVTDPNTGQEIIVCTETVTFSCNPCGTVFGDLSCDSNGAITYNFTVWNNSNNVVTNVNFQSQTLGVTFNPSGFQNINIPANGTYSNTLTINGYPANGLVIQFQLILDYANGQCCHVVYLLTLPECRTLTSGGPIFRSTNGGLNSEVDITDISTQEGAAAEVAFEKDFSLYPVPANSTLNLLPDFAGDYTVTILNINGQIMNSHRIALEKGIPSKLDINDLPDGIYFARCTSADGTLLQKRFIKASR